jgi:hypothetical protein
MLKKAIHGLFQLASPRHMSAACSIFQTPKYLKNDASHPCGASQGVCQHPANRKPVLLLAAILLTAGAEACAHDFWIEPQNFRPAPGAQVPLRLYVGQDFKGDSVIYLPGRIERYAVVGPDGERTIEGVPGDDPAGTLRPARAGLHIVVYRGASESVSFDTSDEFERYLDKEGLERVRRLSDYGKRTSRRPIRELYSRCAKSLLGAGDAHGADRALGLRLELVAEKNPYACDHGNVIPVRLLYEGKPLAGALIVAFNKAAPADKLRLRSDADGRVQLRLSRTGVWLVTAVHLLPAARFAPAEWESLWASLSFELPAREK